VDDVAPSTGSRSIVCWSIVWPTLASVVLRTGVVPTTVTSSVCSPMLSTGSSRVVESTLTAVFSTTAVRKPLSSARTV
jgi:hypothetical protein